jgi:uncharacterized protein (DUF1015 family)
VCLVRLSPFGQGQVIPHERTYQGPIEDRLKLMRATGAQLSPIFGLFSDARNEVSKLLYQNVGKPELDGTLEGVRHQLWSVIDAELENHIIEMMGTKPVYIADGHHRYTTALAYQKEVEREYGGPLPPDHPANYCMFVLVGMQSDGLLVLPTHRLIGGLSGFDAARFKSLVARAFDVSDTPLPPDKVADYANSILPQSPPHTMGLYDGVGKRLYQLTLKDPDVLAPLEPARSEVWRRLDVAILQRYLLDEIFRKNFAGGKDGAELSVGYTADAREIAAKTDGKSYQVALLLKATPMHALEELGKSGDVMPQKSTYFYPKLATGMTIYPLR